MTLDSSLPWEKVAEPQKDFVDLDMLWYTAYELYGYTKPAKKKELSLFDGRIGVNLFTPNKNKTFINYDDYSKNNLDNLLEFTINLTPYSEHVSRFLDVYHPFMKDELDDNYIFEMNTNNLGCSCGPISYPKSGSIEICSTYTNPIGAGDGIIHEVWHQRLHALGIDFETHSKLFFTNQDDELFDSPIRKDKLRPMPAVIQAQYSYIGVTEYYKSLIDVLFHPTDSVLESKPKYTNLSTANLNSWLRASARNVYRIREGVETIRNNIKPTPDIGERFIYGYIQYANRVINQAIEQIKYYEQKFNVVYDWGVR
jgi:hypothetical protein